ncbi:MAG TPA: DUF2784 domain-containing protein [Burkholderiaceae bacterium]|nr:DUF2784 domain-containing protein [Burkholderiaceae bacterium]
MLTRFAADLVVLVHAAFIVFVVIGGLLVLRFKKLMWAHLPAVAWGAMVEFGGWVCPLTPLETMLRRSAGEAGYPNGFIEHYVLELIYPPELSRQLEIALGLGLLVANALIYAFVWHRRSAP